MTGTLIIGALLYAGFLLFIVRWFQIGCGPADYRTDDDLLRDIASRPMRREPCPLPPGITNQPEGE